MTTNESPSRGARFLRSPEIFRPRNPDISWPLERTLPSSMHQRTTTTIAQDIEDLLQFLDDFAFPNSPDEKPTPLSPHSVRMEVNDTEDMAPNPIGCASPPDRPLIVSRALKISPVVAPETETDPSEESSHSSSTQQHQSSPGKNDNSVHEQEDDAPDIASDILPFEKEESRVKLTQWVRQIRAAVQETVQHYRHYIQLLQQQKSSPGATTFETQQVLLSYESELHTLHCQLQQIQHEYQQTVESLQSVIEQQSRTIHNLQQKQRFGVANTKSPEENKPTENAAGYATTPHRRVSPSLNDKAIGPAVAPTPMISPNSCSSSSNKENRFMEESSPPEEEIYFEEPPTDRRRHHRDAVAARIVPSKVENCKTIQFHNGTIQEIYYAPSSSSSVDDFSKRHRRILYDIIRFPNGDIKMATAAPEKGETEVYYYYAASGIIQLTYFSSSSSKTIQRVTEYHYPDGHVEYHHEADGLVVVKCPNGRVLHHRRKTQPPIRRRNERPHGSIHRTRAQNQLHR